MSMMTNTGATDHGFAAHFGEAWLRAAVMRCRRRWDAYRTRRDERRMAAFLRSWADRDLKDIAIARGQIELAVRGLDVRGEHRPRGSKIRR